LYNPEIQATLCTKDTERKQKYEHQKPTKRPGLNPGAREGQVVSCYIITHMKD